MTKKESEKKAAISLRKRGLSYNEILREVPIAKSTLSVWLKDIGLAKKQRQRLTLKRKAAQVKAQESCRNVRIARERLTIESAKKEIKSISKKELWLIGIALYWAEGSKQKKHNVSQRTTFNNSDPRMILLFDRWLQEICGKEKEDLHYSIYIHRSADIESARKFWSNLVRTDIKQVYLKTHNPKTKMKNCSEDYHGLLRIDVRNSTDLNRKISGWVLGILESLKIET
jgi:hypothetical protein